MSNFCADEKLKKDISNVGFKAYMDEIEKNILSVLIDNEKSVRSLARKLKIIEVTLHRKLKKHQLNICK